MKFSILWINEEKIIQEFREENVAYKGKIRLTLGISSSTLDARKHRVMPTGGREKRFKPVDSIPSHSIIHIQRPRKAILNVSFFLFSLRAKK